MLQLLLQLRHGLRHIIFLHPRRDGVQPQHVLDPRQKLGRDRREGERALHHDGRATDLPRHLHRPNCRRNPQRKRRRVAPKRA